VANSEVTKQFEGLMEVVSDQPAQDGIADPFAGSPEPGGDSLTTDAAAPDPVTPAAANNDPFGLDESAEAAAEPVTDELLAPVSN